LLWTLNIGFSESLPKKKRKNSTKLESYIAWTALDNVNDFLIAQMLP
jgi:hypothetical protein